MPGPARTFHGSWWSLFVITSPVIGRGIRFFVTGKPLNRQPYEDLTKRWAALCHNPTCDELN